MCEIEILHCTLYWVGCRLVLTPIIFIRLHVTSQVHGSAEILISYVYRKFVINLKAFTINTYRMTHFFFFSSNVSIEHRVFAHTSGKKHWRSISFFILKCLFVSFEVDKIKVKYMRDVDKLMKYWLLQSAWTNDLQRIVIKVPYTYTPV